MPPPVRYHHQPYEAVTWAPDPAGRRAVEGTFAGCIRAQLAAWLHEEPPDLHLHRGTGDGNREARGRHSPLAKTAGYVVHLVQPHVPCWGGSGRQVERCEARRKKDVAISRTMIVPMRALKTPPQSKMLVSPAPGPIV